MGERKGTNLYYPPDYDPKKGGLNKFLGTHALRERARKLHMGILIIRFEMPYNIWCDGCNNHIGMGVRYNAEKKKVGMYYSTPVYQFRMKCHLCDNHFEIKTDPANFDYVIVSGARRQENRWDPTQNEQVVPEDKATSKRLFDDAMFKLEHGDKDQKGAKSLLPTLSQLAAMREDRWQDDYSANCALRQNFRAAKKTQKKIEARDRALTYKFGLDLPLLPETESDVHLAKLLALKPAQSILERQSQSRQAIIDRPVLPSSKVNEMRSLIRPLKKLHAHTEVRKHFSQILVKRRKKEDCSEIPATSAETENSISEHHTKNIVNEAENTSIVEVSSDPETNTTVTTIESDKQKLKIASISVDDSNNSSACPAENVQQFEGCTDKREPVSESGSIANAESSQENTVKVKDGLVSYFSSTATHVNSTLVDREDVNGEEKVQTQTETATGVQEVCRRDSVKSHDFNFPSPLKTWVKTFTLPTCGPDSETVCDSKETKDCMTKTALNAIEETAAVAVTENCSCSSESSVSSVRKQTICLVDSEYHGSTSSDSDDHAGT